MDSYHTGAPSAAVAHTPPVKTNMRGKIFKVCGSCGTMAKSNRSFSCHTCKAPFPPSTKKRASKKRASKKRTVKKRRRQPWVEYKGRQNSAAPSKRAKHVDVHFLDELMVAHFLDELTNAHFLDELMADCSSDARSPDAEDTNAEPGELRNPPFSWTMDDDELFAEFCRDQSSPFA